MKSTSGISEPCHCFCERQPSASGITSGFEADGYEPVRSVIAGGPLLVELTQFGLDNWQ